VPCSSAHRCGWHLPLVLLQPCEDPSTHQNHRVQHVQQWLRFKVSKGCCCCCCLFVVLVILCRIEVGTETGVDRSKSVMSYLVHYFNQEGNYTVQVGLFVC
jgi:hypothetical protein